MKREKRRGQRSSRRIQRCDSHADAPKPRGGGSSPGVAGLRTARRAEARRRRTNSHVIWHTTHSVKTIKITKRTHLSFFDWPINIAVSPLCGCLDPKNEPIFQPIEPNFPGPPPSRRQVGSIRESRGRVISNSPPNSSARFNPKCRDRKTPWQSRPVVPDRALKNKSCSLTTSYRSRMHPQLQRAPKHDEGGATLPTSYRNMTWRVGAAGVFSDSCKIL
jgi:hypothetical protein